MHWMTLPADEALGAVPALHRSGWADAVTLLTVLVAIRLAIPSQLVVGLLGGAGAPATLFGLLLLAYWLWHRLRRVVPEQYAAVNGAAIALGAIALASYAAAAVRPIAVDEFNLSALSLLSLAGWMGGLLLASDGVTSPERLQVLVSRLAIMGGAFAGFGLVQFVTGMAWVDRLSIPGLVVNTPVYAITQREGFSRPFSTAIHPIEFGSVIAMLLPLAIVFGLLGPPRGGVRWRNWIPAILTVTAALLSSSRSTLVGLALGIVLLWPALTGLQRLVGGVATVALGTLVFVTVPSMVGTISGLFGGVATPDSSVASRLDSFGVAADYFSRAPIIVRGFGSFLPRYRIFDNQYLLVLV